jgi:hypothetical protein
MALYYALHCTSHFPSIIAIAIVIAIVIGSASVA